MGKTSLLNALQPDLGIKVKQVSGLTSKGRHSTVVRELFPMGEKTYLADLPGLRSLGLWDIHPEELDAYFPEMRELCRSNANSTIAPIARNPVVLSGRRFHKERFILIDINPI